MFNFNVESFQARNCLLNVKGDKCCPLMPDNLSDKDKCGSGVKINGAIFCSLQENTAHCLGFLC